MKLLKSSFHCSIIFLNLLLFACGPGGDNTKELSGGYFFRDEGTHINDILSHLPNQKEIPANVVSYDFDDEFIIALQRPNKTDDPLYESKPFYQNGRDTTYYWLIIHSDKLVLGPMNEEEFNAALKQHEVPEELRLEAVD